MEEIQNIQWFPGHMQKTKRMIEKEISLIDLVIEVLDARLCYNSRNIDIENLIKSKKKLMILNKCDLADPLVTNQWIHYYKKQDIVAINCDCKTNFNINKVVPNIKEILNETLQAKLKKNIKNYKLKVMVIGIPNVGKSSFINKLSKKKSTKVEDRPGVTRGKQWITINSDIELLDTPGVLMPKINNQITAQKLAFIGTIKDNILDIEGLAVNLIEFLKTNYKNGLMNNYKLNEGDLENNSFDILNLIAKKRGMLLSKGEYDTQRASIILLDEFRMGKLGKISFDKVSEIIKYEEIE